MPVVVGRTRELITRDSETSVSAVADVSEMELSVMLDDAKNPHDDRKNILKAAHTAYRTCISTLVERSVLGGEAGLAEILRTRPQVVLIRGEYLLDRGNRATESVFVTYSSVKLPPGSGGAYSDVVHHRMARSIDAGQKERTRKAEADALDSSIARGAGRGPGSEDSGGADAILTAIHVTVTFGPPVSGGCKTAMKMMIPFTGEGGSVMFTTSYKSENGGCGPQCVLHAAKNYLSRIILSTAEGEGPNGARTNSLRHAIADYGDSKKIFAALIKNGEIFGRKDLCVEELAAAGALFGMGVVVSDGAFCGGTPRIIYKSPLVPIDYQFGSQEAVCVVLHVSHYFHVNALKIGGRVVAGSVSCPLCKRELNSSTHRCYAPCETCKQAMGPNHQCGVIKATRKRKGVLEEIVAGPAEEIRPKIMFEERGIEYKMPVHRPMTTNEIDDKIDLAVSNRQHVLLHGPGGSGKTTIVLRFLSRCSQLGLSPEEVGVCSSTAISALSISGITAHKLFGIGMGEAQKKKKVYPKLRNLKVVVIEEVSMIGDNVYRQMSENAKRATGSQEAFGGLVVIHLGDALQLEPVGQKQWFYSRTWGEVEEKLEIIPLSATYRFTDQKWSDMLSRLRLGVAEDPEITCFLKSRMRTQDQIDELKMVRTDVVEMRSTNKDVDEINNEFLEKLPGETKEYPPRFSDTAPKNQADLIKSKTVRLKIGCKVMLRCNDYVSHALANGSVGIVTGMSPDGVLVRFANSLGSVQISYVKHYVQGDIGRSAHCMIMPLSVCYVMTIHKMQGVTIRSPCVMSIGEDIFAASQAYVALSRVADPNNIFLTHFESSSIFVRKEGRDFDAWCVCRDRMHFSSFDTCSRSEREYSSIVYNERACRYELTRPDLIAGDRRNGMTVISARDKSKRHAFWPVMYDFETHRDENGEHSVYGAAAKSMYFHLDIKTKKPSSISKPREGNAEWVELCRTFIATRGVVEPTSEGGSGVESKVPEREMFGWIMKMLEDKMKMSEAGVRLRAIAKAPIVLCAYNGNRYDHQWFLRYILENGVDEKYSLSIMPRGSSGIVSFTLSYDHKVVLCTHDLCDVLSMPLREATQIYGKAAAEECAQEKGYFPHLYLNSETYEFLRTKQLVKVELEHFPKEDRKAVKALVDAGTLDLDRYDLYGEYKKYFIKDVEALCATYEGANDDVFDMSGASVFSFVSATQLAMYCNILNMEPEFRQGQIERQEDDLIAEKKKKRAEINAERQAKGLPKLRYRIQDKRFLTNIYRLTQEENEFISPSITGGIVAPRVYSFTSTDGHKPYAEITDCLYDCDVNSMYPADMKEGDFPVGPQCHATEEMREEYESLIKARKPELLPFGFYEIEFLFDPLEMHPSVAFRHKGRVILANCAPEPEGSPREGQYIGRPIRTVCSNIDIESIFYSRGYVIPKIYKAIVWGQSGKVYRGWINKTIAVRMKGKAMKEEGLRTGNKDMVRMGTALEASAKRSGCSTYGGTLQQERDERFSFITTQADMERFHATNIVTDMINEERVASGKDKVLMVQGKEMRALTPESMMVSKQRHHGSLVLAYSHMDVNIFINAANPFNRTTQRDPNTGHLLALLYQPVYGDTDSLMLPARCMPYVKQFVDKRRLGFLGDDLNKCATPASAYMSGKCDPKTGIPYMAKIIDGRFPGKKTYALKYVLPESVDEHGTLGGRVEQGLAKAKGIPSSKKKDLTVEYTDRNGGLRQTKELGFEEFVEISELAGTVDAKGEPWGGITISADQGFKRFGCRSTLNDRENERALYRIGSGTLKRTIFSKLDPTRGCIEPTASGMAPELSKHYTVPFGYAADYKIPYQAPWCAGAVAKKLALFAAPA